MSPEVLTRAIGGQLASMVFGVLKRYKNLQDGALTRDDLIQVGAAAAWEVSQTRRPGYTDKQFRGYCYNMIRKAMWVAFQETGGPVRVPNHHGQPHASFRPSRSEAPEDYWYGNHDPTEDLERRDMLRVLWESAEASGATDNAMDALGEMAAGAPSKRCHRVEALSHACAGLEWDPQRTYDPRSDRLRNLRARLNVLL